MVEICRNCRLRNQEITVEVILFEYSRRSWKVFEGSNFTEMREGTSQDTYRELVVFFRKIYLYDTLHFATSKDTSKDTYRGLLA